MSTQEDSQKDGNRQKDVPFWAHVVERYAGQLWGTEPEE